LQDLQGNNGIAARAHLADDSKDLLFSEGYSELKHQMVFVIVLPNIAILKSKRLICSL